MMRFFRVAVTFLFIAMSLVFVFVLYTDVIKKDSSVPVITIDQQSIDVKIGVSEEELLKGVTASDKKDGDLTSKVIVESLSHFTEKGVCTVTYAVCDSDHHVANAERTIRFTDYKSPHFVLLDSLCFVANKYQDVTSLIGAVDDIDGDITSNVIVTSDNFQMDTAGTYKIKAKATNSMGETITIELPAVVEEKMSSNNKIELKDYLIYVKKGTTPNFNNYIVGVKDPTDTKINIPVTVSTDYNANAEGIYSVNYYATDEMGRQSHSILLVVVEK